MQKFPSSPATVPEKLLDACEHTFVGRPQEEGMKSATTIFPQKETKVESTSRRNEKLSKVAAAEMAGRTTGSTATWNLPNTINSLCPQQSSEVVNLTGFAEYKKVKRMVWKMV